MSEAVILSAVRTPIGRFLGELADVPAPRLGAVAVAEAIKRAGISVDRIDEVIMGNVVQAGVGQNPARQAALFAGLPDKIAAFTVNKVCGSGLKAVMLAAQAIRAGDAEIIVAGGMESMSKAPFLLPNVRMGYKYGDQKVVDALIHDGLWCAFENWHMGEAAEHIATTCGISRGEQDRFSVQSHRRAAAAWESGAFQNEIVAVTVGSGAKSRIVVARRGLPSRIKSRSARQTQAGVSPRWHRDRGQRLATERRRRGPGRGVATGGGRLGAKPLAKIISYATSGVNPKDIFIAPVAAVNMAVKKAGLRLSDIDLFELNEAFASQMLACNKELQTRRGSHQRQWRGDRTGAPNWSIRRPRVDDAAPRHAGARRETRRGIVMPGRRQRCGHGCGTGRLSDVVYVSRSRDERET